MKILAAIFVLPCLACGGPVNIDSDFRDSVDEFIEECGRFGIPECRIRLHYLERVVWSKGQHLDHNERAFGVNRHRGVTPAIRTPGEIIIGRDELEENPYATKAILFHELGHALLYKGHNDEHCIMSTFTSILRAQNSVKDPNTWRHCKDEMFQTYQR